MPKRTRIITKSSPEGKYEFTYELVSAISKDKKTSHDQISLSSTLTAAGFSVIAAFRIIHHPAVSKLLNIRKEVCNQSKWLKICGLSPKTSTFSAFCNAYNTTNIQLSLARIVKLSGYLHIIP